MKVESVIPVKNMWNTVSFSRVYNAPLLYITSACSDKTHYTEWLRSDTARSTVYVLNHPPTFCAIESFRGL